MKIGIDVSQMVFENTGVSSYLLKLIQNIVNLDDKNEYVLFFSSLRRNFRFSDLNFHSNSKIQIKRYKFPPMILDFLWNKLHILPIENFIGDIDVFITSDWTEPPTRKAKKATILYDLIVYKYPSQTDKKIVETQKRKLEWVKKETDKILCISQSTANDAYEILEVPKRKLEVIGAGV